MTDLTKRIAALSPEKRELLLQRLNQQTAKIAPTIITAQSRESNTFPLSFAQERLWFIEQLQPGNVFYNITHAVRLQGKLNIAALEQSINEIIRRHEALRTTFTALEGKPVQVIASSLSLKLSIIDLCEVASADQEQELQKIIIAESLIPFDLTREPLLRVKLLQLNQTEYLMVFTMHHIISDIWSIGVLVDELAVLYPAFCHGNVPSLPELPIQYPDFAVWQRNWLQGKVWDEQLAYWKQQLANPPILRLPTDRPRPAISSLEGATQSFVLSKDLAEALNSLSRSEGVTLFMTLLAAFKVLLHRYTGQEDICIGSPIANRNRGEIEKLIGFFVNSLVLRTHLDSNLTFRELLVRVRDVTLGAYDRQDFPFEKIVEELQPERNLSYNPLFQVSFQLQNTPMEVLNLPDLTLSMVEYENQTAAFDLHLCLSEEINGEISASLEYSTELFDAATIARMIENFRTLLAGIVANPQAKLFELPLLTETEQHQLLVEWNETQVEYPLEKCLHQCFEAQVGKTPDAIAVVFENQHLTYSELNIKANQLAFYLRSLGVQADSLVGICVERSLEMLIGILGILKAGGAYVPLDPTYPQERLAFMLEDSQTSILLSQQHLIEKLPLHKAQVICLDSNWHKIAAQNSENLTCNVNSHNLAYVIYTSGSTGKPKGVLVNHANVVRLFTATDQWFHFNQQDVWTLFHSYAFDFSVWEIWGALIYGGKLVIVPYWISRSPDAFYDLLSQEQVTVLNQTPSAFRQLMYAEAQANENAKPLSLRLVIFGGEALEIQSLKPWFERHGDQAPQLVNMYGITETTVHVTYYPLTKADLDQTKSLVGRPIPDLQIYLLDQNQQLVPIGVPGEIYIGGAGVARGYLNRPQLTEERFIDHCFANNSTRIYKTGDLARYLPNGDIEYLGRIDHQVKIRGFRIELGEIEASLRQHKSVEDALVISTDNRLVSYVIPNSLSNDQELLAQQVSEWRSLYNETYSQTNSNHEASLNLTGWNSSYTNLPIPQDQMQYWVDSTVERILACQPQRVLEIGCGTGLLLLRVAPHCSQYCATDFSATALNYVQKVLDTQQNPLPQVKLFQRLADNFEEIEATSFDTVIINSVIQYFPSINYLLRVLEGASQVVESGGAIFVGDVRNLTLLSAFHTSIALYNAPDSLSTQELQQQIQQRLNQEEELVIDPAFFLALPQHLPQITYVQIQPKRGYDRNELTLFRYDVILHVGNQVDIPTDVTWLDWQQQGLTLTALLQLLESTQPRILGLRRVPDARLIAEVKTLELLKQESAPQTVGELRSLQPKILKEAVEPEDIWALGDKLPYKIEITWTNGGIDGCYDVLLQRQTPATEKTVAFHSKKQYLKSWHNYANNPLQGKIARQLVPELRQYLQSKLPEYMLPSAFVLVDAWPLTANGKIDRRSLPSPDQTRLELEADYVVASNPIEEKLVLIWSEVLVVQQIGVHDNFFNLGGHSLLATQVISRVRDAFNVELPLSCLFSNPTVAGLAESIQTKLQSANIIEYPPIHPVSRNEDLPLSFAQQRLWFLSQLVPDSPLYNVSLPVRLTGLLDISALKDSFNAVVQRHEILRTSFVAVEGQPMQVIVPNLDLSLPIVDLQTLEPSKQATQVEKLATEEELKPFDLACCPLLRVKLLRLHETEHILLLTMHHIISDGWSMGVLVEELATLYEAFSTSKPNPLPPLPIQYADFAVWQRQWLQGEVLESQLAYWKKQLLDGNLPTLKLPIQRSQPASPTFNGASYSFELSGNLSQQILELSRQESATLFMTLLAGLQTLLYRYTNLDDIVVGTDIANRTQSKTELLIGFFINLLVLRTDMRGNPSFRELLQRVREVTLQAYAHQDLPFDKLVEELKTERDLQQTPLFQVLFVLQNTPAPKIELADLKVHPLEIEDGQSKFDLALFAVETEQKIAFNWRYKTDFFDETAIARLSTHFETLLTSIVAQPDTKINSLEILNPEEKQQQISEKTKRQSANFQKFKMVKPKAISLTQEQLVKTDYLQPEKTLPLVCQPNVSDLDFIDWAKNNREFIDTNLLKHGAILFRGFNTNSVADFENFAQAICPELFGEYGDLPREGLGGKVYGSTPYPADKAILFHNESSHLHRWPMKIWFYCVQPAQERGETPIVDCRKLYQLLDSQIREKFAQKGLMYVRNYTDGLDVSWQNFFHTTDKSAVERFCYQNGIEWEWKPDGGLKTQEIRQAIAKHPKTNEWVFFNQIQLHHIAYLDTPVRESLLSLFGEENLPRNVYYGDGTSIEQSVIDEVTAVYKQAEITFPWQKGDVLMLDNMLTAHARNPYVGNRKIVVAMGKIVNAKNIEILGVK
jgi:amino acid adenylation domain-containing protein